MSEEKKLIQAPSTFQLAMERLLFGSKWLLVPFYFGLVLALAVYLGVYLKELGHMLVEMPELTETQAMLIIIGLVDMGMIAALVFTAITGGYASFVNKYHTQTATSASSGMLKVKMATSLIGVSSIHLLKKFIAVPSIEMIELYKLLLIHVAFIGGAIALMYIEYLHIKTEKLQKEIGDH